MDITIVIVAAISAIPPTLMALLAWRESKKLHVTVNSRMDELLTVSKAVSKAEGKEAGKIEERKEVAQRKK